MAEIDEKRREALRARGLLGDVSSRQADGGRRLLLWACGFLVLAFAATVVLLLTRG